MSYQAGDKIICIDTSEGASWALVKGRIYTCERVYKGMDGGTYVNVDCCNGSHPYGSPCGWFPHRFRPLKKTQTDISTFTQLLDKTPELVK